MACNSCSRNRRNKDLESETQETAADFLKYVPNASRIKGTDRKWHSVSTPLVSRKPIGRGWTASVLVGDRGIRVAGRSAPDVINKIMMLYSDNGIEAEREVVWYNYNLYLLKKSLPKDRRCSYEDLITLADVEEVDELYHPSNWQDKAQGMLTVYLAQDNYSQSEFMSLLSILKGMYSDDYTGCIECYDELANRMMRFENVDSQDKARDWLGGYINAIRAQEGKIELTKAQLKTIYKWR